MKKIIKQLFNKIGYDFVKVNVHKPSNANKIVTVKVGNFNILMPGNNQQISLYKYFPNSNTQLARLAKNIIKKYSDAAMVDIGANVGDTIAVVRSLVNIPIVAIEGDDLSYSFLLKNVVQFNEIYTLKQFLGEEKQDLKVSIEKEGWNNTILPDTNGNQTLELKTLDQVLFDEKLDHLKVKLLKLDTEGFDTIILRGCLNTMSNLKPILYFEYNGESMNAIGENGFDTIMLLKEYGYNNIYIFDCINNLIFSTTLDNKDALKQLHDYAHTKNTMIPYFDICIFHSDDTDIANDFVNFEKANR
jgi:FkbM family methyltransferase